MLVSNLNLSMNFAFLRAASLVPFFYLFDSTITVKYVSKVDGISWTSEKVKSLISESIQMSQTLSRGELEQLIAKDSQLHAIRPAIALAYISVLEDCEAHCFSEGTEVKKLGGLHVIGTSLHESRRIDNQV